MSDRPFLDKIPIKWYSGTKNFGKKFTQEIPRYLKTDGTTDKELTQVMTTWWKITLPALTPPSNLFTWVDDIGSEKRVIVYKGGLPAEPA